MYENLNVLSFLLIVKDVIYCVQRMKQVFGDCAGYFFAFSFADDFALSKS